MKKNGVFPLMRLWILGVYLCLSATTLVHSDATKSINYYRAGKHFNTKPPTKFHAFRKTNMNNLPLADASNSNTDPYVSSPFSLPPYNSLSPQNTPPFCVYPPPTTPTPSNTPTPVSTYPPPPPGPTPTPPTTVPTPNPPTALPNPPTQPGLSPPNNNIPSPNSGSVPSPRFLPPIVYPPPMVPHRAPARAMWCVAKASVPDPITQEAMNYACGSGANCDQILDNGSCFQPNTVFAHASYAFNSYWQRTKMNGGRCDFGGTAVLVTVDPSYDGCHFMYS